MSTAASPKQPATTRDSNTQTTRNATPPAPQQGMTRFERDFQAIFGVPKK